MTVAIAGWAWRTPLGVTIGDAVARLFAGERAAIANPLAVGFACTVAAPIVDAPATPRNARFLRRMGLFGMAVAKEALVASGLEASTRFGLFSGVGGLRAHWDDMMPALANQRDDGAGAWARGLRDVHPYWMLRHLSNNVHALVSAELGLRGEGATFGGGNASAQAMAAAARALQAGAIDAAVVVTYDSLLEPETLVELGARHATTQAAVPIAPYDPRAAGYVPGEAAAAVVLVRECAVPLAHVDAFDTADGEPGEPAIATVARVLRRASVVDGAARARPDHDAAERAMLADVVDAQTPLTAITAAMGQLGAATSMVQAIALAECLRRGMLPPIAGLATPASGPLVPVTRATPTTARSALALATSAPGLVGAIHVEVR
jgi:3-oxoacyl-(acyl-carrier-protein) synthase